MSYPGNIREIVQVSQKDLHDMIENETHVIRVGATTDVDQRASQYEREGYSGIMYFARTENMKRAEDKLLEIAMENDSGKWNVHEKSNVGEGDGYIYAIKGKRFT